MSDDCVPQPKARKTWLSIGEHFAVRPWGVQLQIPSPAWVSPLHGVSSSHQHTLPHKAEKIEVSP